MGMNILKRVFSRDSEPSHSELAGLTENFAVGIQNEFARIKFS